MENPDIAKALGVSLEAVRVLRAWRDNDHVPEHEREALLAFNAWTIPHHIPRELILSLQDIARNPGRVRDLRKAEDIAWALNVHRGTPAAWLRDGYVPPHLMDAVLALPDTPGIIDGLKEIIRRKRAEVPKGPLTNHDLATAFGVTTRTIYNWMRGETPIPERLHECILGLPGEGELLDILRMRVTAQTATKEDLYVWLIEAIDIASVRGVARECEVARQVVERWRDGVPVPSQHAFTILFIVRHNGT